MKLTIPSAAVITVAASRNSVLLPLIGLAGLLLVTGCTTVKQSDPPVQTSTTTEHTIISRPASGYTETQTTRNY